MTTTRIYCVKCRDNSGHRRSLNAIGDDYYRNISVIEKLSNASFKCKCLNQNCGHEWVSKSQEASLLFGINH